MPFRHWYRAFLLILSVLLANFSESQTLGSNGRVAGAVRNERNEPLVSATITIEKTALFVKSDINGAFEIDLKPGTYTLIVSYTGHETKNISEIVVKKGEITRQDVSLNFAKSETEVVVTATTGRRETVASVFRLQKNNIAVSDVLSLEQIKRTPDNNIAQSLKRMNGVTVLDNKFVVVRGMGDRYNNVTINGSLVPSTEANRKNFSFDLLPTDLIENIVVNKTATPDLPADFAGGLVQINTKDVPEKNLLSISAGVGYNTNTTGKEFLSTDIHPAEYFAKFDDRRKWFLKTWEPVEYFKLRSSSANNASQINRMNATIPNFWGLRSYDALPISDFQVSTGLRRRFANRSSIGFIVAGTYRNEQNIENYLRQGIPGDSNNGKRYGFVTNIGGLASLAYTFGSNKLSLKNIYSRRLTHETFVFEGRDAQANPQRNYISNLTLNVLLQSRLEGEHSIPSGRSKFKWFLDRSTTDREQPDNRNMKYAREGSNVYLIELGRPNEISWGSIFSSKLDETRYGWGFDAQQSFELFTRQQKIKFGYLGSERESEYIAVFLRPTAPNPIALPEELYGLPDYEIYETENFRKGRMTYNPLTTNRGTDADAFSGKQTLHAGYLMGDLELIPKLRLTGGVRMENYSIGTSIVRERDATGKVTLDTTYALEETKFFPSINAVYALTPKLNFRAAYSRTVSRFDFREFVNIRYTDFSVPADIYGNPRLKQPFITNGDVRVEWFPAPAEIVSASLFYKKFENPIEFLIDGPNASQTYSIFTLNQRSSDNIGVEVDFRKSFSFIHSKSKFLSNLFINGNVSVMNSEVDIDRNEVYQVIGGTNTTYDTSKQDIRKRSLQGLSRYAINAGLLYQGARWGWNVSYNRFDRRLIFAGAETFLDIYESPRDVLDFQVFLRVMKNKLEMKVNVSDMLNDPYLQYNNSTAGRGPVEGNKDPKGDDYSKDFDFIYYRGIRGVNISFSMNYKF
jgi:hypothetical protein